MTKKKKPKAARPSIETPAGTMTTSEVDPVVLFDDGLEPYEPTPPPELQQIAPGVLINPANTDATPAVAPLGRRLDKGFVWEIEPGWTERVERMADAAGLPPDKFLDSILRRAWIALPMSKRGGA